jgi:Ser-tRNA(Ala) deacylase AlaX
MTGKIFWDDAYVSKFSATVLEAAGGKVILDRTAFNPRGGGLVGDTGTISGVKVIDTLKDGESIQHVVEDSSLFFPGAHVEGELDWERRYRIMRMHTAAHALSAVFNRESGALITGNRIEPEESRIDFSIEKLDRELMNHYIDIVNAEIERNPEVKSYFMPREEAMKIPSMIKLAGTAPPQVDRFRIVEIVGLDIQADGGVHVRRLGELKGIVPVKFENKGKSNRRIYFRLKDD